MQWNTSVRLPALTSLFGDRIIFSYNFVILKNETTEIYVPLTTSGPTKLYGPVHIDANECERLES